MDYLSTFHTDSSNGPDSEALKDARSAKRNGEEHASRIAKLEFEISKLSVVSEALWELLKRDTDKSDAELVSAIETVAANRLAQAEHKMNCLSCGMSNAANKKRCIYCGGTLPTRAPEFPFI